MCQSRNTSRSQCLMKTKSILCVVFLVLAGAPWATGQQNQPMDSRPGGAPTPQASTCAPLSQGTAPETNVIPARPPASYQVQQLPRDSSGINYAEWPTYSYSRYHNPYYDGSHHAESFVYGTLDWLWTLPGDLYDRMSNLVEGSFFPPVPATSGPPQESHVPGGPNSRGEPSQPGTVPSAGVPAPQQK
jgi:hypothetical protein